MTITVDKHAYLGPDQYREAWPLYVNAFRDLSELAVQAHLMPEEEFSDFCDDMGVEKHLARNAEGRLIGLGMVTNALDRWPLIAPAYFRRRWPREYDHRKIWYVGLICTDNGARGDGGFSAILQSMIDGRRDCRFCMDYCSFREDQGIVQAVQKILTRLGWETEAERMDTQAYWSVAPRSPKL